MPSRKAYQYMDQLHPDDAGHKLVFKPFQVTSPIISMDVDQEDVQEDEEEEANNLTDTNADVIGENTDADLSEEDEDVTAETHAHASEENVNINLADEDKEVHKVSVPDMRMCHTSSVMQERPTARAGTHQCFVLVGSYQHSNKCVISPSSNSHDHSCNNHNRKYPPGPLSKTLKCPPMSQHVQHRKQCDPTSPQCPQVLDHSSDEDPGFPT
jgi:hypothetical protein